MKNLIYALITIIVAIALPLLTSWLNDWSFISAWWPRKVMVIILMLLEIAVCVIVLNYLVKQISKEVKI